MRTGSVGHCDRRAARLRFQAFLCMRYRRRLQAHARVPLGDARVCRPGKRRRNGKLRRIPARLLDKRHSRRRARPCPRCNRPVQLQLPEQGVGRAATPIMSCHPDRSGQSRGMGLQRLCSQSATLPQLKQIHRGFFVSFLISSNRPVLARTQRCPLWSPLQTCSDIDSSPFFVMSHMQPPNPPKGGLKSWQTWY